ncbi:MAG: hypothetical protein KDD58_16375, partial [Bdellovibrionales bacterium]|nr:hypothetical protein [Bdellovibrionales bacterium]
SLVEWLFSKGADPNFLYRKKPPLILAVTQRVSGEELGKLFGVIRLIVSHPKIDLNLPLRGKPLLTVAIAEARKRNYGQIEVFLESFAN